MRSLPLLLALLIGVIALTLGLVVMFQQPSSASSSAKVGSAKVGSAKVGGVGPDYRNGLPQGHVYAGVTSEPDDVNPFTCHGQVARRFVLGLTHEGLLDTDPVTGELRGAVAESWQFAADGRSCTFTLREGICFSDGTPVTMADVMFGWELAAAGHLAMGFVGDAYARVEKAEATDERTLRVTLRERYYAAEHAVGASWLVAQRSFFINRVEAMSRRLGQQVPEVGSAEFAELLARIQRQCGPGTGPFQLPSDADESSTWRRRQDLLLVPSPHHWRRQAEPGTWNIGGMRLLFREGSAVFNALLAREVDWFGARSVDALLEDRPELVKDYRKLTYDYAELGVIGIVWNCSRPPFDDVRVRRALGMLMDRDAIIRGHPDRAVPAMAFAKPGSPAYPTVLESLPFKVSEARRALRDAGFDGATGKPLRLSLLTVRDGGPIDLAVDLLMHAAKDAGVEITPERLSFPAYVAKKKQGQWDGLLVNRSFRPWGDPFDFVHSEGLDNDGHWHDEEADRLAATARVELDADKRAALWQQLHLLVYQQQPFTFLYHPRSCILFNKHIQGAEPGPRGLWPERWWVEPRHRRR